MYVYMLDVHVLAVHVCEGVSIIHKYSTVTAQIIQHSILAHSTKGITSTVRMHGYKYIV